VCYYNQQLIMTELQQNIDTPEQFAERLFVFLFFSAAAAVAASCQN
jgi:hypothetical protein